MTDNMKNNCLIDPAGQFLCNRTAWYQSV